MRKFFPVEELARDERFHQVTMRDRMADGRTLQRDADGSAPIVVVGNSGDPVTPLPGAVDMAEDLESGVLLTWQGQGHTAYPKTDCVTAAVNAYLVDLTAPADGLTCPA